MLERQGSRNLARRARVATAVVWTRLSAFVTSDAVVVDVVAAAGGNRGRMVGYNRVSECTSVVRDSGILRTRTVFTVRSRARRAVRARRTVSRGRATARRRSTAASRADVDVGGRAHDEMDELKMGTSSRVSKSCQGVIDVVVIEIEVE